jgi:hypothetical protein
MEIRNFVPKFSKAKRIDGVDRRVIYRYEKEIFDFLSMFPEKHEPNDFTRFDVLEWTRARGWSVGRSSRSQSSICTFWNWLIRNNPQRVLGNPARFPRPTISQPDTRYRALSQAHIHALRTAAQTDQEKLLLALGLLGLTQGEVAGLSQTSLLNGHIYLPDRQLPVQGTSVVDLWPVASTVDCTLNPRSTPDLSPLEFPSALTNLQGVEHLSSTLGHVPTADQHVPTVLLWRSQSAVREQWTALVLRAQEIQLGDYNWQRLRRTLVCKLLLSGATPYQVAHLLGCSRHAVAQFVLPHQEKPLLELVQQLQYLQEDPDERGREVPNPPVLLSRAAG